MDQFPQMLYRAGGAQPIHGGHFDTLIVDDETAHAAAVADGWFDTTPVALDAYQAEKERAAAAAAKLAGADEPVKRAELEQKAAELGIPFSARVSDKKLGEAIAAKLAETSQV